MAAMFAPAPIVKEPVVSDVTLLPLMLAVLSYATAMVQPTRSMVKFVRSGAE